MEGQGEVLRTLQYCSSVVCSCVGGFAQVWPLHCLRPEASADYLIGRAPDMDSLLRWAEYRNRQEDPKPITRKDVDMQVTVSGIDPSVLDGHLWAFLNLNLTNQAKDVFHNVPGVHGLEVWRRLIGELLSLTDLRQMDLQTVVHAPTRAPTLPRIRSAIGNRETNSRKYGEVD